MDQEVKFPGLWRRGVKGTWQIRRRIPKDLVKKNGPIEINRTLDTTDEAIAKELYHRASADIEAEFNRLRSLSSDKKEVAAPLLSAKAHYDKIIADEFPYRVRVFKAVKENEAAFWAGEIIELPDSRFFDELLAYADAKSALNFCFSEHLKQRKKNAEQALSIGDRSDYPDELTDAQVAALLQAELNALDHLLEPEKNVEQANLQPGVPSSNDAPLASLLVEEWIEAKKKNNAPSTWLAYQATLKEFLAFAGDKPANAYLKEHIRKYKKVLAKLPPNFHKLGDFEGLDIKAAAKKANAEGITPISETTINSRLRAITAFFNWAIRNYDEMSDNPARDMGIKRSRNNVRDERHPFTVNELRTMFAAPIYTGCKSARYWMQKGNNVLKDDAKFWVPLIGLYTGMRLSEIIQLHKADVKCKDGIYYFDIAPSPDGEEGPDSKYVKTPTSERRIPIHRQLLDIGLMRLVNDCTYVRLFPQYKKTKVKKSFSDLFTKHFRRFLTECKIDRPKVTFHSFRHNFEDACRNAEIPAEIMDELQGHSSGGQRSRYGKGYEVDVLNKHLQKINFKGLNPPLLKYSS